MGGFIVLLFALLGITVILFSYVDKKSKKFQKASEKKARHNLSIIKEIDGILCSAVRFVISDNVSYAIDKRLEKALVEVVKNKSISVLYLFRLKELRRRLLRYSPQMTESSIKNLNIKCNSPTYNKAFSKNLEKVKSILSSDTSRRSISMDILMFEQSDLTLLQVKIAVENLINKSYNAIDIGKFGTSRDLVEKAKHVLNTKSINTPYANTKLVQLNNLTDKINGHLYKKIDPITAEEKRKNEEWDIVFQRAGKRYIPLY